MVVPNRPDERLKAKGLKASRLKRNTTGGVMAATEHYKDTMVIVA